MEGAIKDSLTDFFSEIYRDFKTKIPAELERFKVNAKLKFLEAKKRLFGKTMVILGPPEAGKSTLIRVLQNPEIAGKELESYRKTEIDAVKTFNCSWKLDPGNGHQIEFRFKVKKTCDVGGETYLRENHWGTAIKDAEILIYVFDLKKFFDDKDGTYKARIRDDFDWLLINSQKPRVNFALMLVANKADLLCDRSTFANFEDSQKQNFEEFIEELRSGWKLGIRTNIKGLTLLSLTDQLLRHLTFDNLILGFVGEDLRSLYIKSKKMEENEASNICPT